ncbi:uncharacterized protein N7496_012385 [Penicillium cataractarum]|uniref:2EXR domain-containing protein n=1 Tax=Penicillium cataractarum TaxID=2100454 RepID=A0A9W9R7R0_9EURO|nr:uncharacterized protein N7496_012385 [Penicillium cataractarum]KAJ5355173.1 hypothetical protein N7496_012385 [Penicillium cataractarum]
MDPSQQAMNSSQRGMPSEQDMYLAQQGRYLPRPVALSSQQGMSSSQGAMPPQQAMYPAHAAMYPPRPAMPFQQTRYQPPPLVLSSPRPMRSQRSQPEMHLPRQVMESSRQAMQPQQVMYLPRPVALPSQRTMISSQTVARRPEPQFHLFSRLPAELRIKIWEFCLPNRVVELNHPQWVAQKDKCTGTWTSKRNTLPPAISQVSHEARVVATRAAVRERQIDPQRQIRRTFGFWFQRNRDIVMMYQKDESGTTIRYNDYPFSVKGMEWLQEKALDTAIYSTMINPWGSRAGTLTADPGMHHAPITGWYDPLIIVETIPIHAKEADVRAAGVFGAMADEPIQLVDPADATLLERYRWLCMDRPGTQTESVIRFFNNFTGGRQQVDNLRQHLDWWVKQGKGRELWRKWKAAKDEGFAGIEYPESIWKTRTGAEFPTLNEGVLTMWSPDGCVNLNLFSPNEDHPWVKEKLAGASFTPRIMFRWCGAECWTRRWR